MSEHCVAIEELERVLELPAADPRRLHVESCARCRSLAEMLADFAGGTTPVEAGFAAADARLRDTIAELTGVQERPAEAAAAAAPEGFRPARAERRSPWWSFGGLRPALAFAALLVVASAGVAMWRANTSPPLMRDASGSQSFASRPALEVSDGWELGWSAQPGADRYQVHFSDASLRSVAELPVTNGLKATLRRDALPAGLRHGAEVAWQVVAYSGPDVVGATGMRTLRVP
ncbi:MAG: hypothetical protein U0704_00210 [Candidatus Eisenbacteria bacterium]